MIRPTVTLLVAASLLTACSTAPKPKTLNGRHRQPINVVAIPTPSTQAIADSAIAPQDGAQEARNTPPATHLPENAEARDTPTQELVRVFRFQFPYGGIALAVPQETAGEMMGLAARARSINVRGRTDGAVHSAGDEKVALNRAIAARDYLVKHGVDPTRIQLDYVSGGDYLADNATVEGRSRNRRVEIEFEFFDAVPVAAL